MFQTIIKYYQQNIGFNTFLPQQDGHLLSELIDNGIEERTAIQMIFQKDAEIIKSCDLVVFVMDGRVPDEGACVEIGLAYANNKECFGLKTDSCSLMGDIDKPLIIGAVKGRIAKYFFDLEHLLRLFAKSAFLISNSEIPMVCAER